MMLVTTTPSVRRTVIVMVFLCAKILTVIQLKINVNALQDQNISLRLEGALEVGFHFVYIQLLIFLKQIMVNSSEDKLTGRQSLCQPLICKT